MTGHTLSEMLGLDTMVMDNDEALQRQGVRPTYKRVKGFQPLQMSWGRFVIDAVFRAGDKHLSLIHISEPTRRS